MLDKAVASGERSPDEVRRWPTPRSREWTNAFLDSAGSNASIVAVVAVGSAVRPCVRSGDIDLVVICKGPSDIGKGRPLEVDLRVYDVVDIDARLENGHDMLGWAVKFGRVLFQRDGFWDRVVESWGHRLPLPSPQVARARAAAAYRHLTTLYQLGDADAVREQALSFLTHSARAELLEAGVYPASRPELPEQLRSLGDYPLAGRLDHILQEDSAELSQIGGILELAGSSQSSHGQ